ncbi:MAG: SWIM zinc finger family protein, partial [Bacteroidota bacterium]
MEKFNVEAEAKPEIYQRGRIYYQENRVRHLTLYQGRYQAEVQGSQHYLSQISITNGKVKAFCNCPYSGSGWCKHLVALGLAIQKSDYQVWDATLTSTPTWEALRPIQQKLIHQQATLKSLEPLSVFSTDYFHPLAGDLIDIDAEAQDLLGHLQTQPSAFEELLDAKIRASHDQWDVWAQYIWALQEIQDTLDE